MSVLDGEQVILQLLLIELGRRAAEVQCQACQTAAVVGEGAVALARELNGTVHF